MMQKYRKVKNDMFKKVSKAIDNYNNQKFLIF